MDVSGSPRLLRAADRVADLLRVVALASIALATLLDGWNGLRVFVVVFLVVLVPRIADLPRPVDLAVCVAWVFSGWSNVTGLWITTSWADVVTHAVTPGVSAVAFYLLLVRVELVPPLQDRLIRGVAIVLLTVALGALVGVMWEFYEWIVYRESGPAVGYDDTIADLLMDVLGSLVAGVGLAVWASFGGRTRRLPMRDVGTG